MSTDIQVQYDALEYGDKELFYPTASQLDILDIVLDPKYRHSTIKEKAAAAGCHEQTYHRAFRNKRFRAYYADCLKSGYVEKGAKMVDAVFKFGTENAKNYKDRELFLEYTELFKPNKEVNVNKKTLKVTEINEKITDDELEEMINAKIEERIRNNSKLIEDTNG